MAFYSWNVSRTNGHPHRSGFNFQTALFPALHVILQVQFSFVVNLLIFFLPVMCSKCFFKPHVIFPMFPTVTGMFINFVMNVSFWRPRLHPEVLELTSHTVAALGGLLPSSSLDGIECLNRQFTYRALYITQWHKVIGLTHSLTRSLARRRYRRLRIL